MARKKNMLSTAFQRKGRKKRSWMSNPFKRRGRKSSMVDAITSRAGSGRRSRSVWRGSGRRPAWVERALSPYQRWMADAITGDDDMRRERQQEIEQARDERMLGMDIGRRVSATNPIPWDTTQEQTTPGRVTFLGWIRQVLGAVFRREDQR